MNYSTFEQFASLKIGKPLYQKQETHKQIENEQYQIPLLLAQPYRQVEINQQKYVQVYHHQLNYTINQNIIDLGFITSAKLDQLDSIQFSYHQNDQLTIIHETVNVKLNQEEIFLTLDDFHLLLSFNQYLQADWYKMAHKNIEKNMEPIENYLSDNLFDFDNMKRRYLFTIRKKDEIDWQKIEGFLQDKKGQQQKQSLLNEYLDMRKEDFKKYYESQIFRSLLHQTNYNVYYVIDNIWKRTIEEYFNLLQEFTNNDWTITQIIQYHGFDEQEYESIKQDKLGNLLYNYDLKTKVDSIATLKCNFEKLKQTKEEFKQNIPLAMVQYTRSIKSLQFFRREQYNSIEQQDQNKIFESSCRQKLQLKKPQIQLIPISTLTLYSLDVKEYDQTLTLPMIMLDIERQVIAQELLLQLNLQAPIKYIVSATQTAGYSSTDNYELLETVGDSILKYFATLSVYYHFGHFQNEHQLSQKRNEFVSNKLLCQLSYQNKLELFLRQQFYSYQDWITPVLNNVFQNNEPQLSQIFVKSKQQLSQKTMADIYESILGAIYMNKYCLLDCYKYLKYTRHPLTNSTKQFNHQKYFMSNLCLDQVFTQFIQFNQQASFKDLCINNVELNNETILKIKNSIRNFIDTADDNQFFLDYFQEHILKYKFNNLSILIEALTVKSYNQDNFRKISSDHKQLMPHLNPTLFHNSLFYGAFNYQNLEFLGDAIIETLIITNAYQILQKQGLAIIPDDLQKVKISLLGNHFMARQTLANGFHNFIINHDADYRQYEHVLELNTPFKDYQANLQNLPKILSDIWESVCGAILMDGGWDGVVRTIGKIYQPYLNYICTYILEIEEHVISKVQQYCTQNFKQFEFSFEGDECHIMRDDQILASGRGESEKQAKEMCAIEFCKKYGI